MANILDYLDWRGDLSLEADPFNEIDALILARLAYAPFDRISPYEKAPITIKTATENLLSLPNIEKIILDKHDMDFFKVLNKSPRFSEMTLDHYVNRVEKENQMQFSAITVQIRDKLHFISFRGTDDTLVGWKENFNMSFTCPVPAQSSAVNYLSSLAQTLEGEFILGGHSKGGNLAMYASSFCGETIQERIISVYNFDGPGFSENIISTPEYRNMRHKMMTFVPQSSIVGMLLEHEEQYIIVKSTQKINVLQHDLYSWTVQRNHLCYMDHVTDSSKFIDRTLKNWLEDIDVEQREGVIDAVYSIVANTEVKTLDELDDRKIKNTIDIFSSINKLDDETRDLIKDSLSLLVKNIGKTFEQMDKHPLKRRQKIKQQQ